jgi:hypothetical protein
MSESLKIRARTRVRTRADPYPHPHPHSLRHSHIIYGNDWKKVDSKFPYDIHLPPGFFQPPIREIGVLRFLFRIIFDLSLSESLVGIFFSTNLDSSSFALHALKDSDLDHLFSMFASFSTEEVDFASLTAIDHLRKSVDISLSFDENTHPRTPGESP